MKKLELTPEEEQLYDEYKKFNIKEEYEERITKLGAAQQLTISLLNRSGIPENRLKYFTDSDYQIGRATKSRKEVFESNGTSGTNIFKHGNFLKHLDFFIDGASVNQKLYDFAEEALKNNPYQDDARDEVISYIYRNHLKPSDKNLKKKFGEEVFKMAIDLGFESHYCHDLRKEFSK